jgi:neural Wiskott-Aldrich syndrome protein
MLSLCDYMLYSCLQCSTITLRTIEKARDLEIELASTELTLYSASSTSSSIKSMPLVYPFSIPLPPDTPQCIHTPWSSVSHTLTATLHPVDSSLPSVSSVVAVHTRKFVSHTHVLSIIPETKSFDDPTHVEVQVPRTTFRSGEPIPLYLTIPPPRRELVLDDGIRLRNVRAELIRVVAVNRPTIVPPADEELGTPQASSSSSVQKTASGTSSESLDMRSHIGIPGGGEVIAVSGAAARLHPSETLRLRLILHPRQDEPHVATENSMNDPLSEGVSDIGSQCATISQTTVLHDVSFHICVHVTFMHMSSHTERICTVTIPVVVVPPVATLPEVEDDIEVAYHKKHDRPPTHTNRQEDSDVPRYSVGEAGPSFSHAPPPFEEREAPPPFFPSDSGASTSRLPTFLESETEIYVPDAQDTSMEIDLPELVFEGEGVLYGFASSEQFDGYQVFSEQERAGTPPPTLEMATLDPDVTSLATMDGGAALSALELALEQHHEASSDGDHPPPPPPPLMDDPSDPPPSIDSDFRAPGSRHVPSSPPVHPIPAFAEQLSTTGTSAPAQETSHGHAPPPYRVPDGHDADHDHDDNVTHPPPYVDLVPGHT